MSVTAPDRSRRRYAVPARGPPAGTGRQPVPADRGLRLPIRLRGVRAGGVQREHRVDVPAADGRPVGVRRDARPQRRRLSPRSGRHPGAGGPALPARHDDHGNHLVAAHRLGGGARRAARGAVAAAGAAGGLPARPGRPQGRARAAADRRVPGGRGRPAARVRARLRLRTAARRLALHRRQLRAGGVRGRRPAAGTAQHRPEPGLRGPARGGQAPAARGRQAVLRHVLGRRRTATGHSPRHRRGWRRPRASGTSGSAAVTSPTIPGASTWSGRRSRSRASPTRRPGRCSPRRRRRCRRPRAG